MSKVTYTATLFLRAREANPWSSLLGSTGSAPEGGSRCCSPAVQYLRRMALTILLMLTVG